MTADPPHSADLVRVMNLDLATEIVARHILAQAATDAQYKWDCYPEIGENDWDLVLCKVEDLSFPPANQEYADAYKFLEDRASPNGSSETR